MMAEKKFIDADWLTSKIFPFGMFADGNYPINAKSIKMAIDNAPAADVVEVVHAYWKETTHITISRKFREIHSKLYKCSNCDAPNGRKKSSYCHWCGAKLDRERKEQT